MAPMSPELARNEYSGTNQRLHDKLDDLLDWMSPEHQADVYRWRAAANSAAGDFSKERTDLNEALGSIRILCLCWCQAAIILAHSVMRPVRCVTQKKPWLAARPMLSSTVISS